MSWRDRVRWPKEDTIEPEDLDWENAQVMQPVKPLGVNLATFNLQVFSPMGDREVPVHRETEQDKRVLADMPAMLELVEEQLTDLMPKGYYVQITEWNK